LFLKRNTPFLGTNMLFLHRYTISFHSQDSFFFSLIYYNNNALKK
jgi:hypothetical protein